MFSKILIANRGEIACRVIKTARRMGVKTVAVYSDADAGAMHVSMADEAYHIGGSAAADSYLVYEKIIDVCKKSGAEAVHPGYGFLSENAAFCKALAENDITFIGPPVGAIEAMGSKSAANFNRKVLKRTELQVRSYWAIRVFTGKGIPPKMLASEKEIKKLITENPDYIGYIDANLVDDSVKVVLRF